MLTLIGTTCSYFIFLRLLKFTVDIKISAILSGGEYLINIPRKVLANYSQHHPLTRNMHTCREAKTHIWYTDKGKLMAVNVYYAFRNQTTVFDIPCDGRNYKIKHRGFLLLLFSS